VIFPVAYVRSRGVRLRAHTPFDICFVPHSALPSLGCILLFAERTPLFLRVLSGWNVHVPCPSCYSHSGSGAWWLRNVNLATRGSHYEERPVGRWVLAVRNSLLYGSVAAKRRTWRGVGHRGRLAFVRDTPGRGPVLFFGMTFLTGTSTNRKAGIRLSSALRVGAYRAASLMVMAN
jgi:hypothetical protein